MHHQTRLKIRGKVHMSNQIKDKREDLIKIQVMGLVKILWNNSILVLSFTICSLLLRVHFN